MPRNNSPKRSTHTKTAAAADKVREREAKLTTAFSRWVHVLATGDLSYVTKHLAAMSEGLTAEDCVRLEATIGALCATGALDSARASAVSRMLENVREHRLATLQQVLAPTCVLVPYIAGVPDWTGDSVLEDRGEGLVPKLVAVAK